MNISKEPVAVFARNHKGYLDVAVQRSSGDETAVTVFRSDRGWASAKRALDRWESCDIYFAPVGEVGTVCYVATLREVLLFPKRDDPSTKRLLSLTPESTQEKGEGLWAESGGDRVQTLYAISACHLLKKPFSISDLVKVDGRKHISPNYVRGYAMVFPLDWQRFA